MRKPILGMVVAALVVACFDLGRTIYSDKPCLNGAEVRQIAPNGNPTEEQLARSRMKTRMEEQRAMTAARAAKSDAEAGKTTPRAE